MEGLLSHSRGDRRRGTSDVESGDDADIEDRGDSAEVAATDHGGGASGGSALPAFESEHLLHGHNYGVAGGHSTGGLMKRLKAFGSGLGLGLGSGGGAGGGGGANTRERHRDEDAALADGAGRAALLNEWMGHRADDALLLGPPHATAADPTTLVVSDVEEALSRSMSVMMVATSAAGGTTRRRGGEV